MTGSLKQAKHNDSPRGLISCTNLPPDKTQVLVSVSFCLCSSLPLSYDLKHFRPLCYSGWVAQSFPWATDGHLTGLSEPQASSPDFPSAWKKNGSLHLLVVLDNSAHNMSTCMHMCTQSRTPPVWFGPSDSSSWPLCLNMHTHERVVVLSRSYTALLHIPWALISEYISGEVNVGVSQTLIGQLSPCISVTRQHALPLCSLEGLLQPASTQCIWICYKVDRLYMVDLRRYSGDVQ